MQHRVNRKRLRDVIRTAVMLSPLRNTQRYFGILDLDELFFLSEHLSHYSEKCSVLAFHFTGQGLVSVP